MVTSLAADLSNTTKLSVGLLRYIVQYQRFKEAEARNGGLYSKVLRSHFGIDASSLKMWQPEIVGHTRFETSLTAVVQNSSTTNEPKPLGTLAGMSVTNNSSLSFSCYSELHGYIMFLACVRIKHSYCQGLERL